MDPLLSCRLHHIARALKERRTALGVEATQAKVARQAGISVRHLQKLEAGAAIPRLDTFLLLARALDTDAQSLLDRAEILVRRS
jgi:transcriptional regulator with XRE-family HTH domain